MVFSDDAGSVLAEDIVVFALSALEVSVGVSGGIAGLAVDGTGSASLDGSGNEFGFTIFLDFFFVDIDGDLFLALGTGLAGVLVLSSGTVGPLVGFALVVVTINNSEVGTLADLAVFLGIVYVTLGTAVFSHVFTLSTGLFVIGQIVSEFALGANESVFVLFVIELALQAISRTRHTLGFTVFL